MPLALEDHPEPSSVGFASAHILHPDCAWRCALPFQRDTAFTKDGTTCVRLRFQALFSDNVTKDHDPKTFDVYLDQIALGGKDNRGYLPYCYMNGTSMATPAVTGSAAVVSSRTSATEPAARAAETVRVLKGAMHQVAGYKDLCKQNGQIDLGILGQTGNYAPVLETAEVTGATIREDALAQSR